MPRAFVTGGTGFLGLNLIHELLDQGWRVTALRRPSSKLKYVGRLPIELVEGDVTDIDSLRLGMPERVDAVFHVAANINTWSRRNAEQTRANVEGTASLAAIALERKVRRFIHTSSIAAFGFHDGRIHEGTPRLGARSWINYLRTKAAAEEEVRAAVDQGLDAVILNPANIVGPYDFHNWSTLLWLADRGKLRWAPPGRGSFSHVKEVARAHVAAFERGRTGENYLLGGTDATYWDASRIACELVGRPGPSRPTPAWVLRWAARAMTWTWPLHRRRSPLTPESAEMSSRDFLCSNEKAERELGHRPVSLESMFRDCHEWMVREGRLKSVRERPSRSLAS
jgi:nucleoside-diphosphate-sugar epimerase